MTFSAETPVAELQLPSRSASALRIAKIRTVGQLCAMTREQLRTLGGFGPATLAQLEEALARHGLSLTETAPARGRTALTSRHRRQWGERLTQPLGPVPEAMAGESLRSLGLPRRACRALQKSGVQRAGELERLTVADLLQMRNLGDGSVREVVRVSQMLAAGTPAPAQAPDRAERLALAGDGADEAG